MTTLPVIEFISYLLNYTCICFFRVFKAVYQTQFTLKQQNLPELCGDIKGGKCGLIGYSDMKNYLGQELLYDWELQSDWLL